MYVLEGPQTVSPPTRAQALPTQLRWPLKPTQLTGPQRRPVLLLRGSCFFCGSLPHWPGVVVLLSSLTGPVLGKESSSQSPGRASKPGAGMEEKAGRRGRGPGGQGQRLLILQSRQPSASPGSWTGWRSCLSLFHIQVGVSLPGVGCGQLQGRSSGSFCPITPTSVAEWATEVQTTRGAWENLARCTGSEALPPPDLSSPRKSCPLLAVHLWAILPGLVSSLCYLCLVRLC